MKKASIISIGDEILAGQIVDSNMAYLASRLLSIGIPTVSTYSVGDDVESIVKTLQRAAGDGDVILVTGGLGSTDDDLTRQAFAALLRVELKIDKSVLGKIQNYFEKRGISMPEKNKIQAYVPAGATVLANDLGTAPGIMSRQEGRIFVSMPGVPSEMKEMFARSVWPELQKLGAEQVMLTKKVKCFGTSESRIAQMLGDLMHRDRTPLINCTVECGVITLTIVAEAKNKAEGKRTLDEDEKRLRDILGELVYGTGEQTLAQVVGGKMAKNNKTLAVAESCTGGLLAKLITDVPGASRYLTYGWVAYSNEAKVGQLGVPWQMIERYGAVSEQVAQAMAEGARERADTDFTIAITGIAGPGGGTAEKPVGLVYIALKSANEAQVYRFIFTHDRGFIRLLTAQTALNILRLAL